VTRLGFRERRVELGDLHHIWCRPLGFGNSGETIPTSRRHEGTSPVASLHGSSVAHRDVRSMEVFRFRVDRQECLRMLEREVKGSGPMHRL